MKPNPDLTNGVRAAKPPGLVDLLPGQARRRRGLEQTMLATFESWAYELIATSPIELLSTVELGVQAERLRELFKFADGDGRMLALVGERTVSVARVAAGQLQQAPLPLRLCYLGATFQGHPPPGSRRESFQAGAELIGPHSPAADAEVVAMAIAALEAAGLTEFQVDVGHVGFFGGIVERLNREHRDAVVAALAARDLVGLEAALADTDLRAAEQDLLLRFPAMSGDAGILDAAAGLVDNPASELALAELREVYRLLEAYGVAGRVNIDLGAVRDFDYYTGIIFEVFAPGAGAPLAAGGRYDGLLQRFGYPQPATGLVVFIDRADALLAPAEGGRGNGDLALLGYETDPASAVVAARLMRRAGRAVALDVEPSDEAGLRARGAAMGAGQVMLCEGGQAFLLDAEGRTPVKIVGQRRAGL